MLSLDLFDSRFEKKLHEGAVDDTIARLIDPLSRRAIDIRTQIRSGRLDAKKVAELEREYEDLVQKRLDIILGHENKIKETQSSQQPPAKGLLKGKDLVTPQQRVAGATPAKPGVAGAVKDVAGGIKRWLKGEPDQGPTYEDEELDEQKGKQGILDLDFDPSTPGEAVFQQLIMAYRSEVPYVKIPYIQEGEVATLSKQGIYNVLATLLTMNPNRRQKTIDTEFGNFETFMFFLGRVKPFQYRRPPEHLRLSPGAVKQPTVSPTPSQPAGTQQPAQTQAPSGPMYDPDFKKDLGLSERQVQKKKSNQPALDSNDVKDTRLSRELSKARADYPTASSDIEALILRDLDNADKIDSQIQTQQNKDAKHDQTLDQLQTINQNQASDIQDLENRLASVQQQLQTVTKRPVAQPTATVTPTRTTIATTPEPVYVPGEPTPAQLPADAAAKDAEARAEIVKLNQQIKKLQSAMATQPARQQDNTQDQIKQLSAQSQTIQSARAAELQAQQAEKFAIAQKRSDAAKKGAATRKAKQQAAAGVLGDLLGRVNPARGKSMAMTEHGGGIGPRQHWQSLMRNEETHDASGARMYQAKEKFLLRHNGEDKAFYPDLESAKTAAKEIMQDLKGQATVHRVMREGQIKRAMDDYKLSKDDEFYNKYKITKRDFYNTVINPTKTKAKYQAPQSCPQCGRSHESCICEGTAKQFGQAVKMAGYSGRDLEADRDQRFDRKIAGLVRQQDQGNLKRVERGYERPDDEDDDYVDMKEMFNMPGTTIPHKSIIQGYTVFWNPKTQVVSVTRGGDSEEAAIEQVRIGTPSMKNFRHATERLIDKIESDDQLINEGIRDSASATAVVACLLAGGGLSGCATAPQQTTAQQVLKTGQDIGRVVYNAKNITRAGTEEEVRQELKNIARGMSGRPEELNHSNILRIWRRIKQPAEPQNEAVTKEPKTARERDDMIDKIQRMMIQDRNPANLQIMKKDIELIKQRYAHLKEDTAALAAEDAILKRIFVKHRGLMMEYGPEKITQAAESVAYNVGDIAHITDDQITEWVDQVESILGARP